MRRRRFSLSNMPIKHRLPLLLGTLLFSLVLACIWASYRGVKEAALEVGRERLLSLTQQLANQSQQSLPLLLNRTITVANDPAIRSFLQTPSSRTRPSAVAVLQQFTAAQEPNSLQVELWLANHSIALVMPDGSAPEPADLEIEFRQCAADPFKALGEIRIIRDVIVYPAVAAARDDAGLPIGFLVRWRRVSPTPNVRKQLADLLGSQASVYYGNSQGDVWTDLEKSVPKPPVSLRSMLDLTHYTRDGNSVMALGRPISGTPWFVVVEFPDQVFLAQANRFLRRISLIGLGLLLFGVGGAVVLSRGITVPLRTLTEASSAVSTGDYSRTVDVRRADELGTLAGVFNVMVVKVRESQLELERKALLFEESPLPIWVFDRETFGFLAVNEAALCNYGFSRQEFLGMTIKDIRPPEEVPKLLGSLSRPATGLERSGIWKHLRKDGSVIDVEITSHPIDFNGRPAELVLANDITDRIRAQETLRNKSDELAAITQQLWQASKLATMGELAASIAHELNNPLATVSLRVEALQSQLSQDEPKQRSLQIIISEIERMATLVTNLLQFTRRSHRQVSTIDVREEITSSVEFVSYFLRNRKIEAVKEFEDSLRAIHADRQQLRQLFLNLVTNASDAMPDGGTLTVHASNENLAGGVVIGFTDTGQGIAAEDLEKIWEPFYTSKPEGKGTGLGLSICRRIVEEHGGAISVESKVGNGTTVRITLPANNEAASEKDEASSTVGAKAVPLAEGSEGVMRVSE